MAEKKQERLAIFIDGSNLYHSLKRYKIKVKFQDIITILGKDGEIVNIFYYTALLDKEFDEKRYLNHKNFLEKIKQIPHFNIVLCNLRKTILKDGSVDYAIKGDDIYLANDLIKGAFKDEFDKAVIVSGDEDFIPAIKTVQELNKKVANAFFPKSSSYLLRKCCNSSINLRKELNKKSPNVANHTGQLLVL